jgi:hypothetical protein
MTPQIVYGKKRMLNWHLEEGFWLRGRPRQTHSNRGALSGDSDLAKKDEAHNPKDPS